MDFDHIAFSKCNTQQREKSLITNENTHPPEDEPYRIAIMILCLRTGYQENIFPTQNLVVHRIERLLVNLLELHQGSVFSFEPDLN